MRRRSARISQRGETPQACSSIAWWCLAFFLSTAFRNTVGNGQFGLVALLTFLIAWTSRSAPSGGIVLALGSVKYSFAPPLWVWLLLERQRSAVAAGLGLLAAAWVVFSLRVDANPLHTLFQPIQRRRRGDGRRHRRHHEPLPSFSLRRHNFRRLQLWRRRRRHGGRDDDPVAAAPAPRRGSPVCGLMRRGARVVFPPRLRSRVPAAGVRRLVSNQWAGASRHLDHRRLFLVRSCGSSTTCR